MKKSVLLSSLILLILSSIIHAQEPGTETAGEIETLLKEGLDRTQGEIRSLSGALTFEQKLDFFKTYKKPIGILPLLNVVPGFGLGSALQKHKTGQLILFVPDALGVGMVLGGVIWSISSMEIDLTGGGTSTSDPGAGTLMAIGGITMLVSRLIGFVLPTVHAPEFNARLRFSLRMEE